MPPKNPTSLAEKIVALVENKPLREEFGKNGRIKVSGDYLLERMVTETEEVYNEAQ